MKHRLQREISLHPAGSSQQNKKVGVRNSIPALRTYTLLVECNAALRAAVDVVLGHELRRSRIHTTRKGDLGDVEFILQQVVDNLDHPLDRQRLLRDYQTAIGIGRGQLRLEGRALL